MFKVHKKVANKTECLYNNALNDYAYKLDKFCMW